MLPSLSKCQNCLVYFTAIILFHTNQVTADGFQLAQSEDCGKVDEIPGDIRTKVPWVAGIFVKTASAKPFEFYVTGTVIGPSSVLTILGGVYGQKSADGRKYTIPPAEKHLIAVGLKTTDLQSRDEHTQLVEVSHVIPFTGVDENNNQFHFFLFQLKSPLRLDTPYVRPACLPVFSKTLPAKPFGLETEVRQGGFTPTPNSKTLQLALVNPRIEKPEFCQARYRDIYKTTGSSDHLYCGVNPTPDKLQCTSYGSSPVVPVYNNRWFMVGITALHPSVPKDSSWCSNNMIYFYGRFTNTLDWILEHLKCPSGSFACGDGECIAADQICNRRADCADKRDEDPVYCRARKACNAPGKTFECGVYGPCLKNALVCNGVNDCPEGEDEAREVCGNQRRRPEATTAAPASTFDIADRGVRCPPLQRSEGVKITCRAADGSIVSCSAATPRTVARFECLSHYETTYRLKQTEMTCKEDGKWKPFKQFGCKAQCGILDASKVQAYIVEGQATSDKDQFPWHTAIFAEKDVNQFQFICGGSLIEKQILITAAHCVTDVFGGTKPPNQFRIVLGGNSSDYSINQRDDQAQLFGVDKILIPATYDRRTLQSDIALMKLDREAVYGERVRPVCYLQRGSSSPPTPGTYGKVPGFGYTADNKIAANLLQASFPVINESNCIESLKKRPPLATFCAGYKNGTSVCQGDSGGGMVFSEGTGDDERYWLKGIVSHGDVTVGRYCDAYNYAVFTHVDSFADWILQKLDALAR